MRVSCGPKAERVECGSALRQGGYREAPRRIDRTTRGGTQLSGWCQPGDDYGFLLMTGGALPILAHVATRRSSRPSRFYAMTLTGAITPGPARPSDSVFYELHVGTSPAGPSSAQSTPGHLADLGITTSSSASTISTGSGMGLRRRPLYAVHEAYGGRCPQAVCRRLSSSRPGRRLDVVYNHLGRAQSSAEFGSYFKEAEHWGIDQSGRRIERTGAPVISTTWPCGSQSSTWTPTLDASTPPRYVGHPSIDGDGRPVQACRRARTTLV